MKKTLAHRYSSESTRQELSNEYQYERVEMVFKNLLHPYDVLSSSIQHKQNPHGLYRPLFDFTHNYIPHIG